MSKSYVVEKVLEIVITEDDLTDEEQELTEDLAVEIAQGIDNSEWQQIDLYIAGVQ